MKIAYFEPGGDPIVARIVYKDGLIAAGYGLKLSEKDSNKAVFYYDGDNLNPENDIYDLPEPVDENDGRIMRLRNEFYGLAPKSSKRYEISLDIYQGVTLISSNIDVGTITGKAQSSLLFTKLMKKV